MRCLQRNEREKGLFIVVFVVVGSDMSLNPGETGVADDGGRVAGHAGGGGAVVEGDTTRRLKEGISITHRERGIQI